MNSNNNNQENGQSAVRIGTSLQNDANTIQDLLNMDSAGIVMRTHDTPGEGLCIYRPTTPLKSRRDAVKTVRLVLALVSVLGSISLTPVKSPNEVPKRAVNFETLCQTLRAKSVLNSCGDD
ncbi:MAG: hypothetical protein IKS41_04625 [Alphaproteobacteria bacterium]|nr:hypothetical protein [Alphaproteobacteria bacterium]